MTLEWGDATRVLERPSVPAARQLHHRAKHRLDSGLGYRSSAGASVADDARRIATVSTSDELVAFLGRLLGSVSAQLRRTGVHSLVSELSQTDVDARHTRTAALQEIDGNLVDVYRDEAAFILYQRCRRTLMQKPIEETFLHHADVPTQPDRETAAIETLGLAEALAGLHRPGRGRSEPGQVSPSLRLILASVRLVPSDSSRILLAVCLFHAGAVRAAEGLIHRVMASRPSTELFARAWSVLGMIAFHSGRHGPALEHYLSAARFHARPSATYCALVNAVLLGDAATGRSLLERTNDLDHRAASPVAREVVRIVRFSRRRRTLWLAPRQLRWVERFVSSVRGPSQHFLEEALITAD